MSEPWIEAVRSALARCESSGLSTDQILLNACMSAMEHVHIMYRGDTNRALADMRDLMAELRKHTT
jgi:hypothetical protein